MPKSKFAGWLVGTRQLAVGFQFKISPPQFLMVLLAEASSTPSHSPLFQKSHPPSSGDDAALTESGDPFQEGTHYYGHRGGRILPCLRIHLRSTLPHRGPGLRTCPVAVGDQGGGLGDSERLAVVVSRRRRVASPVSGIRLPVVLPLLPLFPFCPCDLSSWPSLVDAASQPASSAPFDPSSHTVELMQVAVLRIWLRIRRTRKSRRPRVVAGDDRQSILAAGVVDGLLSHTPGQDAADGVSSWFEACLAAAAAAAVPGQNLGEGVRRRWDSAQEHDGAYLGLAWEHWLVDRARRLYLWNRSRR